MARVWKAPRSGKAKAVSNAPHLVSSTLRIAFSPRHSRLGFSGPTHEEGGFSLAVPSDVPVGHLAVNVGS